MTPAHQFTTLYNAVQSNLGWSEKQISDYLGIDEVSRWHKKNGQRVTKRDLLSLAGLLAVKRVAGYRKLFWEIADVK